MSKTFYFDSKFGNHECITEAEQNCVAQTLAHTADFLLRVKNICEVMLMPKLGQANSLRCNLLKIQKPKDYTLLKIKTLNSLLKVG